MRISFPREAMAMLGVQFKAKSMCGGMVWYAG